MIRTNEQRQNRVDEIDRQLAQIAEAHAEFNSPVGRKLLAIFQDDFVLLMNSYKQIDIHDKDALIDLGVKQKQEMYLSNLIAAFEDPEKQKKALEIERTELLRRIQEKETVPQKR